MPSKTIDIESLKKKAKAFRRDILETLEAAGSGHPGGSLSAVEIFLTLYGYQINHKPDDPHWEDCIDVKDLDIIQVADKPEDVVKIIKKFYAKKKGK